MSITPQQIQPVVATPGTPEFGSLVRTWMHYDNLSISLSKQASNSRKLRDNYEDAIINSLKKVNAINAVIQVTGGKIQVNEEKSAQHLSMNLIEQMLHSYYKQYGKQDDTDNIIKYIKANRGINKTSKLKRIEN